MVGDGCGMGSRVNPNVQPGLQRRLFAGSDRLPVCLDPGSDFEREIGSLADLPGKRTGWDLCADANEYGPRVTVIDRVYILASWQTGRAPGIHNCGIDPNHWACSILARDYSIVGLMASIFTDTIPGCLAGH